MAHRKPSPSAYLQEFQQSEDGAVAVIFALLILFVFVPILAVSTELGLRTMDQRKLQQQADMAAYSAIVALNPVDPDQYPTGGQCPDSIALQAGYLAALRSGHTPLEGRVPTELSCMPGQLDEIIAVDDSTAALCGLQNEDLEGGLFLCVRLALEQDRLFSRIFSLFTNQDANESVQLFALSVARFPTPGGGGITPCIRARATNSNPARIGSGGSSNIDAEGCLFISEGTITQSGNSSIKAQCRAGNISSSNGCTSLKPLGASDSSFFSIPRGLEWVTAPSWSPPSYCTSTLPSNGLLVDGRIYCTNNGNAFDRSGAGSILRGSGPKGNLIIIGPNANMSFTGNAGFAFNALTWQDLPPALRNLNPSSENEAAGILIYAPNSNISFGGNSATFAGDGCQGIIANTVSFQGGGSMGVTCDRERSGNPQGEPPKPISLAF